MNSPILCPCGSKKAYGACCEPYHEGKVPENALKLMQTRYAAYERNRPEYIIETTHLENQHYNPNTADWKENISKFSLGTEFNQLEIHDSQENGNEATVTFTAHISQDNKDATFTEKSFFEKHNGRWFYLSGQVRQGRNIKEFI